MTLLYKAAAEALGTGVMVFAGFGAIFLSEKFPDHVPVYCVPIVFGLTISAMIFAVGRVSGAHFNPAVTLAFVAVGRLPVAQMPIYCLAQLFGGLVALGFLKVLLK